MRTSQFLEDMTRFLISSASFQRRQLAAELAAKRGSKNLESALSLRLAGKTKKTEVLEGVEMVFYNYVVEERFPFSYLQRLIEAQRIFDLTIGTTDKVQLHLHIERGKFLDGVSEGKYPKVKAMKRLLEGVDGAIGQIKTGSDLEERRACAKIGSIKLTAEMLIDAVEEFKKREAGQIEQHPSDWFFMAYAGNMASWVISEIPAKPANEGDIKALYAKLHASGALRAMSKVATDYGGGNWERLYNLANALVAVFTAVKDDPHVQNARAILDESVKVYAAAIRMNPRLANFKDIYLASRRAPDVEGGEIVQYPADGIEEPIEADKSLTVLLDLLERKHTVLLHQARDLIKAHRDNYASDYRNTVTMMSKALTGLKRRPVVDKRKSAGAFLAVCVAIASSWLPSNAPDTRKLNLKPVFPLVETVRENLASGTPAAFPFHIAMSKPVFPLDRAHSSKVVEV